MLKYVENLKAERDELTAEAVAVTERAAAEGRELTAAENTRLASMRARCAELDPQLEAHAQQLESVRKYAQVRKALDGGGDPFDLGGGRRGAETRAAGWGETFTTSEGFTDYDGGRGRTVTLPGVLTRAALSLDGAGDGVVPPARWAGPAAWTPATPLLDAVNVVTVAAGHIEWFSWPAPYPTAQVVAEGAVKPEAPITPEPHSADLDTYAHWAAITRQALEDIPQAQSTIETQLRGGVLLALEAAAAAALDDTDSGIPSLDAAELMSGLRLAVAHVQSRGYAQPNAVLLNPTDFAALDLAVMGATVAGPVPTGNVWGIPVVAVPSLPAGTAYVGDFRRALTLFTRGTATAYLTDSHSDFFVRNQLLILAEQRAFVAVTEPAAAEQVVVTSGGEE